MFVIVKFSRKFDGHSYNGPSCNLADIARGITYTNIAEAKKACNSLQKINPVGWDVYTESGKLVYSTVKPLDNPAAIIPQ